MARRLGTLDREVAAISEMAIGAPDRLTFRRALLELLEEAIVFDGGAVMSSPDGSRLEIVGHGNGYDPKPLERRLLEYMAELNPSELLPAFNQPAVDTDLFSPERRDQLSLYREHMRPNGIRQFLCTGWKNRHEFLSIMLARTCTPNFRNSDAEILGRLLPIIQLAEAYFGAAFPSEDLAARSWGLSRRESQVAELASRGLSNPEIAAMLRLSTNTVRNQLAAVFQKSGVASRAELSYLVGSGSARIAIEKRRPKKPGMPYPRWLTNSRDE